MSFFQDFISAIFGGNEYSSRQHFVAEEDIKRLVSQGKTPSLSQGEERLIEQAIAARRRDGKISLLQVDEVLRKLEHAHRISEVDRQGVMHVFKEYLGSR